MPFKGSITMVIPVLLVLHIGQRRHTHKVEGLRQTPLTKSEQKSSGIGLGVDPDAS